VDNERTRVLRETLDVSTTAATAAAPPDPELRQMITLLRRNGHPPFHLAGVELSRELAVQLRRQAPPTAAAPDMLSVEDLVVGSPLGVPVRRYLPSVDPLPGRIVYLHGGGWVVGGIEESDQLCRTMAAETGCEVLSVAYRLAPEHPFPAGLDDADAVVTWVADTFPGVPIVLIGDSAGGNLAAVVARRFRDRGRPEIVLQVLVYPVTDHRMNTKSYGEHGEQLLIGSDDMRWFWEQYVPEVARRSSPDASPLLAADLKDLPPALLLVAEYDPLRDEVIEYAGRLFREGVEVTVDRYETMAHGFFPLVGTLEMSRAAVRSVAIAVRRALA
jgi:acetyl esterase